VSTTALTPVFANTAGELLAHPGGYAVLRYRRGATALAPLSELITRMGALLVARGWQYLFSDARQLPPLPEAAKEWVHINWVEGRILRPRLVHVALVRPAEAVARLSVAQALAHTQGLTRYTHFSDEATAHAFLANQLA
jgi:hypothetical protein